MKKNLKKLAGLGFRAPHFTELLNKSSHIEWIEVISENYIGAKGLRIQRLESLREIYDVALHGVSLNIASESEINWNYLEKLKKLISRIDPIRVSDHLCWTGSYHHNFHDLLPFPYTLEMLKFISEKILKIQDYLGRELILENLSAYVGFDENEMSEYEFIRELHNRTGCFNLLDINNLYVNATNYGFDPYKELKHIPATMVKQVHIAGFSEGPGFLIDTHSKAVCDGVWGLFKEFYQTTRDVPFMMEWDAEIPEFPVLENEVKKGSLIIEEIHG